MQHEETMIFSAELDNDAFRILRQDQTERATLAYVLMNKTILWHPAYDLQEPRAHRIMLGPGSDRLGPPLVKLVLGKAEFVSDYMPDRIRKLEAVSLPGNSQLTELEEYRRYTDDELKKRYDALDERFTINDGVMQVSWSRDAKFRELVRQDLSRDPRTQIGLGALLLTHASYRIVEATIKDVLEHVAIGLPVVSCDTILAIVRRKGFHPRAVRPFEDRLHLIHWMAQEGPGIHIPLLSRLYRNTIDPYDPDVFWCAINCLLGEDLVNGLFAVPWSDRLLICQEVRKDPRWLDFIKMYCQIIEVADEERDGLDTNAVLAEVRKQYPSKGKYIFNHVKRMNIAVLAVSLTANALLWLLSPPTAVTVALGVRVVGILPVGWSAKNLIKSWRQAAREYDHTDREDLQHTLRTRLRDFHRKGTDGASGKA